MTIESSISRKPSRLPIALHSLNDIIGLTTTKDILGRIFSTFCIGK
ncbi:MAG: hypothetical protein IT290_02340 [Deltaproteobacteria bacterium]|nr:hypothetical protein [Deltaproteobacteria bacterium]